MCYAHIISRFRLYPKHIEIITIKNVEKDSELTINYGDDFLDHNNIICKCGACNNICNLPYDEFMAEMCKRERSDNYLPVRFNIIYEFRTYLNDNNYSNPMAFSGVEIWYHLLYDTNERIKSSEIDSNMRIVYIMIFQKDII